MPRRHANTSTPSASGDANSAAPQLGERAAFRFVSDLVRRKLERDAARFNDDHSDSHNDDAEHNEYSEENTYCEHSEHVYHE